MSIGGLTIGTHTISSSGNETLEVDIDAEDNQDDDNNQDDYIEKIKLKNGPGTMRKRKTEAIL